VVKEDLLSINLNKEYTRLRANAEIFDTGLPITNFPEYRSVLNQRYLPRHPCRAETKD